MTWNRTFGKHDVTLGANTDYYWDNMDNMSVTGYGVGQLKSMAAINQSIEGNRKVSTSNFREKTAQLGVGLLGGYCYDGIYDIFGTYKADASSILPKDKRWNAAWAVGVGWNMKLCVHGRLGPDICVEIQGLIRPYGLPCRCVTVTYRGYILIS